MDGLRHWVKVGEAIEAEIEDLVSPFDPDGPLPKLSETRHPALSERVQGLGIEFSGEGKSGYTLRVSRRT